jgi:tRNA A37 threonylcarbamoyltransferase TsaD
LARLEGMTPCTVQFCPQELCSDNAVMIAVAALHISNSSDGGVSKYSNATNYASVDDKTTLDYFIT